VSYKITKSEPVGRELKRVAAGQVKRARGTLNALAGNPHPPSGGKVALAVHDARTRFKKVRGLLRLARPGLGKKEYKTENRFFRDAGRKIRAVRDATALVEALDSLVNRSFKTGAPAVIRELRTLLVRDVHRLARCAASRQAAALTVERLDLELKRVEAWKLEELTWKEARQARDRSARACRKAFEAAVAEPTVENLHEWRKRTKVLLHGLLLTRKRSPKLREHVAQIERLARLLGEDHDLALLGEAATGRRKELHSAAELKIILPLLAARRKQLRCEAFALAKGIYGESESGS
jgi:hypothetical protein